MTTGRELAFRILKKHLARKSFLEDLFDDQAANVADSDRRLAREIAAGVVRRKATLDAVLATCLNRPLNKTDPAVQILLRMAAYELIFLSTPSHAAVHETIEVAKRNGQQRAAGFLNGVLRNLDRHLGEEIAEPSGDAIPIAPGRYRRCEQLELPQSDSAAYFAAAVSIPEWLIARWMSHFDAETLRTVCFAANAPPPIALRVNRLKQPPSTVLEAFAQGDVRAEAGELEHSIRLLGPGGSLLQMAIDTGSVSVQDESAQRAVELLNPQPGETVLDLCAAPGTKTAAIAETMGDVGKVVACDSNSTRLKRVNETIARLHLTSVETRPIAPDGTGLPNGPFDAALVDVPCSNTGVLAKRADVRWRLTPEDFDELPQLQLRLLTDAARRIAIGGRILYSTCSIDPAENQDVVSAFLDTSPEFNPVEQSALLPNATHDGAFHALLRRM